ncbi:MAG TPA: TIGR00725 family protein [Herpetosiphonaceae bacterium]
MITPLRIAVCGPGQADTPILALAEAVGLGLARSGAIVLCGGLGGVMEAVCRGARQAGGLTVGLLPSTDALAANPSVALPIVTGMGEARNAILIHSAEAVIAVGGGWGTLSEIALARRAGLTVVGLQSWAPSGAESLVEAVTTPEEAVERAVTAARQRRGSVGSAVYHIDISASNV